MSAVGNIFDYSRVNPISALAVLLRSRKNSRARIIEALTLRLKLLFCY
jgi:hypothetical protein